jgi:hypothetical protein
MKTEAVLLNKYNEFCKEEERLEELKLKNFGKKMAVILTLTFWGLLASFESFLICVAKFIYSNEKKHDAKIMTEIAETGNESLLNSEVNFIGTVLFSTLICGGAFLIIVIVLNIKWFESNQFDNSWLEGLVNYVKEVYKIRKEKRKLQKKSKEREEFFKLYELYTNNEDFKKAYNARVSKSAGKEDFLNRVKA